MIQHIVLFTPKSDLSLADRREFAALTLETLRRSPDISRLSVGRRTEVDAGYARSFGDKTYEYSAVIEFDDREALLRYLKSPDHEELGRLFWKTCESTVVMETELMDTVSWTIEDLA